MRFLFALIFAAGCGGASGRGDAAGMLADSGEPDAGGAGENDGGAAATSATLSWNVPSTYTDGTPLVVDGYHIYYGTVSKVYGTPLDVKAVTSYVFKPSAAATYYFAITAYDSSGSESAPSDEVSKVLQ